MLLRAAWPAHERRNSAVSYTLLEQAVQDIRWAFSNPRMFLSLKAKDHIERRRARPQTQRLLFAPPVPPRASVGMCMLLQYRNSVRFRYDGPLRVSCNVYFRDFETTRGSITRRPPYLCRLFKGERSRIPASHACVESSSRHLGCRVKR